MILESELIEVKGGAVKVAGMIAAGGLIITFLIGVLDGFKRPLRCN